MNTLTLAFEGAWKVLAASLVLGAGLPMIFAFGVRSMALGVGGDAEVDQGNAAPKPIGKVLAALCFLVVLAGIAIGITIVVAAGFGKAVSFEHIYPVLVKK